MAAAEVYEILATLPAGIPLPECESQIRPLAGLSPELMQMAWMQTLGMCKQPYVTARVVKRALRQVLKTAQPAQEAKSDAAKVQRYRWRQSVRTGLNDLEALVMGNAHRDLVLAKIGEIRSFLQPLLTTKKKKT
jgi:hypothetical protein